MNNSVAFERPEDMLARGKAQWQIICTPFFRQLTQPKWIRLSKGALNSTSLHSSQISGATSGKTKEPAPKFLLVVGLLNLGIAYSNSNIALGRELRRLFAQNKFDWMENLPSLSPSCPVLEPLVMGRSVPGEAIVGALTHLAELAKCSDLHLWQICQQAFKTTQPNLKPD